MKDFGNIWLPDDEEDLMIWMMYSKKAILVDEKLSYQYNKIDYVCNKLKIEGTECIDIGAHVGLWSMHLVKRFKFVHCFEPIKEFTEILKYNIEADNYEIYNVALGEKGRFVDMIVPRSMTGNTHVDDGMRGKEAVRLGNSDKGTYVCKNIPMISLDEYEFDDIGLIKIDVEGYELPILKGAKETLLKHKPIMVVEQKGNEEYYGEEKYSAYNWLKNLGMKRIKVLGGDYIMDWWD